MLPPDEVVTPGFENGPVEDLEFVSDGQKCIYSDCIGYLSASIITMKLHCRSHGWKKNDPIMWKKCAVQTFFQGVHRKFFEVDVERQQRFGLDILLNDILEEANRRDKEYDLTLNHVMESHIVTKSPWLLRTGWEKKFKGKDMRVLNKLTEKPNHYSKWKRLSISHTKIGPRLRIFMAFPMENHYCKLIFLLNSICSIGIRFQNRQKGCIFIV